MWWSSSKKFLGHQFLRETEIGWERNYVTRVVCFVLRNMVQLHNIPLSPHKKSYITANNKTETSAKQQTNQKKRTQEQHPHVSPPHIISLLQCNHNFFSWSFCCVPELLQKNSMPDLMNIISWAHMNTKGKYYIKTGNGKWGKWYKMSSIHNQQDFIAINMAEL